MWPKSGWLSWLLRSWLRNSAMLLVVWHRVVSDEILKGIEIPAGWRGEGINPSHLTYPLTARVAGAPQMTSQPVSSIFSLFSTALWDFVNPRPVNSLMCFHLVFCLPCLLIFTLQNGFGQTWWTGDMSIPLQKASLSNATLSPPEWFRITMGSSVSHFTIVVF